MIHAIDAAGGGRDSQGGERRASAVRDSLPDSIVVCEGGVVVQANAAAMRLTGVNPPSHVRRRRIEELFPGIAPRGQSMALGRREAIARTAAGGEIPVDLTISSLPSSHAPSFVIVAKPAETRSGAGTTPAETRTSHATLASHAVAIAKIGHEFRTPLNVVLGFGQLLQMRESLSVTQRQAVDGIVLGGNHSSVLVATFLGNGAAAHPPACLANFRSR